MTRTRSEWVEAVANVIRDLAKDGMLPRDLATARLDETTSLEELALDSMGRMDLLAALDERLGVYIAEDRIAPEMHLGRIADILAAGPR